MPRALQAVIVLVLLLLVPAEETFTAPTALEPQVVDEGPLAFDAERAAPCLAEARSVMSEHGAMYRELGEFFSSGEDFGELRNRAQCTKSYSASVARARGIPPDVFMRFEGGWNGHWAGVRARHLWLSVAWNIQLVVVEDDGKPQRAINYVDGSGFICGIVQQADGRERPHEGRWFSATDDEGEYLVWLTPDRNYYERHLVAPDGTRRYRIDEQIPGEQPVPGVEASYETWRTDLDEEDLAEGIRVLATD